MPVTATHRIVMREVPDTKLARARIKAGYKTAAEFAAEHDFTESTYRSHDNGTRPLTIEAAKRYASKLGVSWLALMPDDVVAGAEEGVPPVKRGGLGKLSGIKDAETLGNYIVESI